MDLDATNNDAIIDATEIETNAIRRADELLTQWEDCESDTESLTAAHAYATLATAAGNRAHRLRNNL